MVPCLNPGRSFITRLCRQVDERRQVEVKQVERQLDILDSEADVLRRHEKMKRDLEEQSRSVCVLALTQVPYRASHQVARTTTT